MNDFVIKTITIKDCSRCGSSWSTERVAIEPHEKINFVRVKIAYCPVCVGSFAAEVDRPTYERGKRKIK